MADFKKFFPILLHWEGSSFTIIPGDNGGATKFGVTLAEWKAAGYDENSDGTVDVNDLKLITEDEAMVIAKREYWDLMKGDNILNQSVANFIVDFAYNCGSGTATKKLQHVLGTVVDGVIGSHTLNTLNSTDQQTLFNKLKQMRIQYYDAIVENNGGQEKFLRGWLNRTNSFEFEA